MPEAYGYTGSILHVNLTDRQVETRPLDLDLARKFIGGIGLNFRLGFDLIPPGLDPFAPENPIIIGVGPLVGTPIPGSARVYSLTKQPANNAVGWGSGGGMEFGCQFKAAGYDHLVITGAADEPVYLDINDDQVRIRDAKSLWGLGIAPTVDALRQVHGRPSGVVAIGPGGENLIRFSMAFIDKSSTMGRGGLGAVMGAKNLKAIVARGTGDVRVADRKGFRHLMGGLFDRVRKYPGLKNAHEYGFLNFMPAMPLEEYLKLKKARAACVGCPIGDKDVLEIKEGPHKGYVKHIGAAVNILMPQIYGGHNYHDAIRLTDILDEAGLDMFEVFGLLEFADNLFKHGLLSADKLGCEGVDFKDYDSLAGWFDRIIRRQGFGDFLAEGFQTVLEEYGTGIKEFEPCVSKGLLAYQSVRGPVPSKTFTPFEFGMSVQPRGPASAPGGSSPLYFTFGRPLDWIQGHFDRMGIPAEAQERILNEKQGMAINVGRLTKFAQQYLYSQGSLGICGRGQISRLYSNKLQAELYSAATGMQMDGPEFMAAIERAFNVEKAANVREGFTRKDDAFPERWFEEPTHLDYYEKVGITREIAYGLLDDYYDERGWDLELGVPTKKKLLELDLAEVAADLEAGSFPLP